MEIKDEVKKSDWCPGCGNFFILNGVKKTLMELNLAPEKVVLVSGVGCYAKLPYWIRTYGFVGLHGRELPLAQGIKLANPELTVLAFSGDGAGYGEGGNHFIHTCRRNVNITLIVHNNEVFGLTTGQYSPTSKKGKISKSSPLGSKEEPVNPLALALAAGATFVARAYAGHLKEMSEILKRAIQHPGFAFIDVLQPCVSFGNDYDYYPQRVYYLDKSYDSSNRIKAFEKALEHQQRDKIALGIFYQEKKK